MFSKLLQRCVNVPAFISGKNVSLPAFISVCFSQPISLCRFQRPFFLSPDLHSSSFYPSQPYSLILEAVRAEQTACSENKTQCSVSETEHFTSGPSFLFLLLTKWPTRLLVLFVGVSFTAGAIIFILLSSALLCSPEC